MGTKTTITDAFNAYFEANSKRISEKEPQTINQRVRAQVGDKPSYFEFHNAYLSIFRKLYPLSSTPSSNLLGMFYDDYLNEMPIPSY